MDRKIYIDIIRVIATFAVIITHVCSFKWYGTDVNSFHWQCLNFFSSITRWCVPIFVMISGVFFLEPTKEIIIKKIYSKYILRIVIALLFWSVFYAFYNTLDYQIKFSSFIHSFIHSLGKSSFHLWFLVMIIGLYIIVPFLRKIAESKLLCEYFILLSFIFGSIIPFFQEFSIFNSTKNITDSLHLNFVLGYAGYYILGYYLANYELKQKYKILIYVLGAFSLLFTIIATSYVSIIQNKAYQVLYIYLYPNIVFISISLYILLKDCFCKLTYTEKQIKIISVLSKYSFGIYLIHILYINLLSKIGITTELFNPIFSVLFISLIVFLCSYYSIKLIDKIPYLRKYII